MNFPACKDEQVIYDVRRKGSGRDADSTWVAEYQGARVRIRIVLRVRAAHMAGVLTDEPSGRRVRDIALDRVP